MSNALQSLRVLHNNPFIMAPIFPAFFKTLGEKRNGMVLAYLVLPLVLPPASRKFLTNAKSTSSIMTLAGKPGERDRLFGIEERIKEYKAITNVTLQYLVDNQMLAITGYSSAQPLSSIQDSPLCPRNAVKSSTRLGMLFAPFDVPTIYRTLGIKNL
ncbi:MAG TPA: three component ABC system middle component [Verrucomicrobiae bacterium]|nr:three component ABC system middle component [Verrucomicrobiae bacterium]